MSRTQFHCIKMFILRHAWLNLWDKHMTTGRINQVTVVFHRSLQSDPLKAYVPAPPFSSVRFATAALRKAPPSLHSLQIQASLSLHFKLLLSPLTASHFSRKLIGVSCEKHTYKRESTNLSVSAMLLSQPNHKLQLNSTLHRVAPASRFTKPTLTASQSQNTVDKQSQLTPQSSGFSVQTSSSEQIPQARKIRRNNPHTAPNGPLVTAVVTTLTDLLNWTLRWQAIVHTLSGCPKSMRTYLQKVCLVYVYTTCIHIQNFPLNSSLRVVTCATLLIEIWTKPPAPKATHWLLTQPHTTSTLHWS